MSEEHAQIKTDNGMPPVQTEEQGFRVFIGNLPFDATEQSVRDFIAPVGGEVLDVTLPLKFGGKRPSGYAFVGYATADVAKKAVDELHEKPFGDRTATLQLARSKEESAEKRKANKERRAAEKATKAQEQKEKTLAEGGVIGEGEGEGAAKPRRKRGDRRRRAPGEDDEEAGEGETAAAEANGDGEKPKRKPRNRKPKQPKEARIDGAEGGEETAAGAEGTAEAKPKKARKPRQPKLELTGEQSKNTIFVGNLPFTVTDEGLAEIFTNLSIKVKSAKIVQGYRKPRPETRGFRGSKGFGFVEVEDPAQQAEAVEKVEGSLIGDRKITAKIANEMKPIEKEAAETDAAVAQTVE